MDKLPRDSCVRVKGAKKHRIDATLCTCSGVDFCNKIDTRELGNRAEFHRQCAVCYKVCLPKIYCSESRLPKIFRSVVKFLGVLSKVFIFGF